MRLSIQTGGVTDRFGLEKGYAMLREAGFEAVDWSLDDHLESRDICAGKYRGNLYEKPLEEILAFFAPELEIQRKNGITPTQAHAPFPAWRDNDPELFPYIQGINETFVRICGATGCKNLVIHGINGAPGDEETAERNWQLYTGLIPVLRETGVTVCLENLFVSGARGNRGQGYWPGHCSDAQEAAALIDRLNEAAGQESFGLCLDTGHLNVLRIDPRVYIPQLGSRIKALHIHDNNGMTDQHLAPYNGIIRWEDYLTALRDVDYQGDLSFETFNQLTYIPEDELIPSQLQAISAIGRVFRKYILKDNSAST